MHQHPEQPNVRPLPPRAHVASVQPPTSTTHLALLLQQTLTTHLLYATGRAWPSTACKPFRLLSCPPSPCRAAPPCGGRSCWSSLSWSCGVTWWCGGRGRWVVVVVGAGAAAGWRPVLEVLYQPARPAARVLEDLDTCAPIHQTRTPTMSLPAMPYLPATPIDRGAMYSSDATNGF